MAASNALIVSTESAGDITTISGIDLIIDKSSIIILGVTPNVGSKILPKLKFS